MREPGQYDRWIRSWGWKLILILLTILVLMRIWMMWQGRSL